jgi:hypothetical protein
MSLARLGWPARWCRLGAAGIVARLHRWCWDHLTDAIGTAGDVGFLVPEFEGEAKELCSALVAAGLLVADRRTDRFWVWGAYRGAPPRIYGRWLKDARESAKIAELHAAGIYGFADGPLNEAELEENERGNAYRALRERWEQRWGARHPEHRRYPWDHSHGGSDLDPQRLRALLRAARPIGLPALYEGIDRYLADLSPFYAGHGLAGFCGELGRWVQGGGVVRLRPSAAPPREVTGGDPGEPGGSPGPRRRGRPKGSKNRRA